MSDRAQDSAPLSVADAGVSAPQLSGFTTRDGATLPRPSGEFAVPEEQRYRSPQLLGKGGMGRVVSVHDRRLHRDIALKTPNPEAPLTAQLDARLAREARITARLDHPGILPILDAGVGLDGRAYYTMPIVCGHSLAEVLGQGPAPDTRLRLLRRVLEACEAVAFAHRQGTIHCDLKPANIMLGEGGGTRVLDWGLARMRGEEVAEAVGTPQYMSPEQAGGAPADTCTDVWSLGAILYEVCAGRPLRAPGSASEVLSRARTEASEAQTKLALDRELAPELVAILAHALAPRPEERYRDAGALAEDLGNFLDGRRVVAHTYRPRELLARLVKAWRGPLSAVGIALVVVAVLVAFGMVELRRERDQAEASSLRAEAAESHTRAAFERATDDLARALIGRALDQSDEGARPEAELLAAAALAQRESPLARGVLATWGAAPPIALVSTLELPGCLDVYVDESGTRLLCREADALSSWTIAPDGPTPMWRQRMAARRMASGEGVVAISKSDLEIALLDAETGVEREQFRSPCEPNLEIHRGRVVAQGNGCFFSFRLDELVPALNHPCAGDHGIMGAFAVHPSEDVWAALCEDGTLVQGRFDAKQQLETRMRTELAGPQIALAAGFLSERRLIAGTALGDVVTLDTRTGAVLRSMPSGFSKVTGLQVAPDERLVLVRASEGGLALVEPDQALARGRLPSRRARFARFVGNDVVVAEARLTTYHPIRGTPNAYDLGAGVTSLSFDPGGTRIAATTGDVIDLRGVEDGVAVARLSSDYGFAKSGTFTTDGLTFHLTSARRDPNQVWKSQAWEAHTWQELEPIDLRTHARRVVALADGAILTIPYRWGVQAFFPPEARQYELVPETQRFADLSASPGGRFAVALGERDGAILRISSPTLAAELIGHDLDASAAAIARDGVVVATAGDDGVSMWDADTGALTRVFETPDLICDAVEFAPDMRWIAAGSRDGTVWLWELGSGQLVAKMTTHRDRVSSLAFSPDANTLVSGGWDGWVRFFGLDRMLKPAAELSLDLQAIWGRDPRTVMRDDAMLRR